MLRRTIEWAEPAVEDLRRLYDHLWALNPGAADRVLDRIEAAASRLETLAERGRLVPELEDSGTTAYRELVEKQYRIIYRIQDDRVLIVAALDGRRDLESLLLERLLAAPKARRH
ncbi:MAG: type II toxin-antitoxin system RelE/ParE family toxin [Deltaproteobacteria bacterium]|nr:type II toxin-antitoxin system RelE/ParE family toxin [Deltaproteobacteria bacterium]